MADAGPAHTAGSSPPDLSGRAIVPFYLGGLLGPLGTGVVVPMFPELRDRFGTDSETIGWAFSAYLFPMAALLLVSGTIGERFGRRPVLRAAFVLYVLASVACALAPDLPLFLAGRAAQGVGNAFITPLLVAGLADITPVRSLGRRVGVYTGMQAAGGGAAPFVGGLAASIDWRIAFVVTATAAGILALLPPPGGRRSGRDRPPIRPLFSPRLLALGMAALAGAAGPLGIAVLAGFKTRDELMMVSTTAGLLLAAGNLAGTGFSPIAGGLVDRLGARRAGVGATLMLCLLTTGLGFTDAVWSTALLYICLGGILTMSVVVLQKTGASIVPENRGGALSAVLSFRFAGHALAAVIWVPVFQRSVPLAFVGAGALGLITAAGFAIAVPGSRRPAATG